VKTLTIFAVENRKKDTIFYKMAAEVANFFCSIVLQMLLNIALPALDALSDVLTAAKLSQSGHFGWANFVAVVSFLPFLVFVLYDLKGSFLFFKNIYTRIWIKKRKVFLDRNFIFEIDKPKVVNNFGK